MKPKVLIVDDNHETLDLLRASLQAEPFEAEFCDTGIDALCHVFTALKEGRQYDALLLDCAMPYFDAFTTAEIVRKAEGTGITNGSRAKIAVFTAYPETVENSTLMAESRIDKYFRKPEDMLRLGQLVADWLECEVNPPE